MMQNDPPIHLRQYPFCNIAPHTEDSVTIPVWLTQSSLDGLHALIKYFEGVEKSGKGRVSGSFELTMFYRTIQSCLAKETKKHSKSCDNCNKDPSNHGQRDTCRDSDCNDFSHWEALPDNHKPPTFSV